MSEQGPPPPWPKIKNFFQILTSVREFYGIWGDFDVKISFVIKTYVMRWSTGLLQNPNEIGHGYAG